MPRSPVRAWWARSTEGRFSSGSPMPMNTAHAEGRGYQFLTALMPIGPDTEHV